jgi:type VI secretion system Hcp family effector
MQGGVIMKSATRILISGALGLGLALAFPRAASSAGYLKIGDIKGESTAKGHEGQIDIQSFSWGASSAAHESARSPTAARETSSAMATGKRQHEPIKITKSIDKATPLLKKASADGRPLPSVTLYLPEGEGASQSYLQYELKNVIISSYTTSGAGGGAIPTETLTLNYEKMEVVKAADQPPKRASSERQ